MASKSIVNYVLSEFDNLEQGSTFRILDVGCGKGELMQSLQETLSSQWKGVDVQVYGLEVQEHAGQADIVIGEKVKRSSDKAWKDSISIISDSATWPYEDGFLDCLVSTSVVEHVRDHELFFGESRRVLRNGGVAIHSMPVRERWKDGHFDLLFIHRLRDYRSILNYLKFACRWGLGKFKHQWRSEIAQADDQEKFVLNKAEYVLNRLNYLSRAEVLSYSKKYGFRGTCTQYLLSRFWRRHRTKKLGPYKKCSGAGQHFTEYLLSSYLARFSNLIFVLNK